MTDAMPCVMPSVAGDHVPAQLSVLFFLIISTTDYFVCFSANAFRTFTLSLIPSVFLLVTFCHNIYQSPSFHMTKNKRLMKNVHPLLTTEQLLHLPRQMSQDTNTGYKRFGFTLCVPPYILTISKIYPNLYKSKFRHP